jgi:hypothetical protein
MYVGKKEASKKFLKLAAARDREELIRPGAVRSGQVRSGQVRQEAGSQSPQLLSD